MRRLISLFDIKRKRTVSEKYLRIRGNNIVNEKHGFVRTKLAQDLIDLES